MPTNREMEDDDPEIVRLLEGGGLDPETTKGRARIYKGFEDYFAKESIGVSVEEALKTDEGKKKVDFVLAKYFYTLEVEVTMKKTKEVVKRRPKLRYAAKIRSSIKCTVVEQFRIDVTDPLQFPDSAKRWKSFCAQLAAEGLADTEHYAEVNPFTMEAIFKLQVRRGRENVRDLKREDFREFEDAVKKFRYIKQVSS